MDARILRTLTISMALVVALGHATAMAQTVSVLVAYHSATGNTEKMAQGVAEGAKSAGANVVVKRVAEVTAEDLLSSDGLIIGSPVYFGNMSGEVEPQSMVCLGYRRWWLHRADRSQSENEWIVSLFG